MELEHEDERDEEHRGVEVVVEQQHRLVVVHNGEHPRGENGVQRHEHGGQNARRGAHQGEIDLSVDAENKTQNHDDQGGAGEQVGGLAQDEVSEDDVED